jgi:TonB-linked SusC/RagA family outer membrane protein
MREMRKELFIFAISLFFVTPLFSQIRVEGQIKSRSGELLPGVNVVVKGTTNGAISDVDGNYVISQVPSNATLVFSFIGLLSQEITVNNQTRIDLVMVDDVLNLDEVVAIGYGAVRKRDLTGSVSSVKSEDIVKAPTFSPMEAIQGLVPGMDITKKSGKSGSGVDILIRGSRSIHGSNSPLFIIDGVQGGSYDDLNPSDIESIEVLKDASSTAIYGSQGANGVVIITTKKGSAGKTKVSYDTYFGVNGYAQYPQVRMGEDYIQLRREAYRTVGEWSSPADDANLFSEPGAWAAVQSGQWVDWVDLLMQNGTQQNHQVSISGGNEKTQSFISFSYYDEQGVVKNDQSQRYTIRSNVDHTLSEYVKTGLRSQVTYWNNNSRNEANLVKAASIVPLGQAFDEFGGINLYPLEGNTSIISPLADERENIAVDNQIKMNVNLNAYLEVTPVKGLTYRSNVGSTLGFIRRGIYNDKSSMDRETTKTNYASYSSENARFITWDNILSYRFELNQHTVNATAISSYTDSKKDEVSAAGTQQLLGSQLFYNLGATDATSRGITSEFVGKTTMSYGGRIDYNFKGRYLITVSNRWDGSSLLSKGNKWASFPSIATAWRVSDEHFMQGIPTLSNLKLRLSYGVSGNSGIKEYGTQSLVVTEKMGFGDVAAPSYIFSTRVGNASLGWEKSYTTNLGLDLGFFDNRVSAIVDVYSTITNDILLERTLPSSLGVTSMYQNIGSTENKGVELALNTVNFKTKDFSWTTTFTFSANREKITALVDQVEVDGKMEYQNIIYDEQNALLHGYPIKSYYTYTKLGIWQTNEAEEAANYTFGGKPFQPGDIKVLSLNNDSIISANDDRGYIGDATPDWIAGFQNTFRYKNFDLSVYMFARWGQTIKAEFLGRYYPSGIQNGPAYLDYWTPENPTNDYPRPKKGTQLYDYAGYQALSFVDGSFFKIKNISLGYSLPQSLTQKVKVEKMRIYATANNLFTYSKSHLIQNYDPERGGSEKSPLTRQFVLGVNIEF